MFLDMLAGGGQGALDAYSFWAQLQADKQRRSDTKAAQGLDEARRAAELKNVLERQAVADKRYEDDRRMRNAGVTASMLSPDQEIDDTTFAGLQGTPYEARVQGTQTLPSSGRYSMIGGTDITDPGGRDVRTWMPTPKESRERTDRIERERVLGSLPVTVRRAVEASDAAGFKISPTDLATPEEKAAELASADAREDERWRGRERFQDTLVRGRERDRKADGDAVDPYYQRDRQAYTDYVAVHNRQQDSNVEVDPITGKDKKRPYTAPLTFEKWRAQNRPQNMRGGGGAPSSLPITSMTAAREAAGASGGGARAPLPITPMRSNTAGSPRPSGGGGLPQLNQVVTVRGQRVKVTKINPDGTIEGVPVG